MQMIPVLYFDEDDVVAKELIRDIAERNLSVYLFPVCGQVLELGISRLDFIRTFGEIKKFLNKRFNLEPPM